MNFTQITKIPIQFRHNKNSFLQVNKLIVKVFSCKIQKLNVNGVFFNVPVFKPSLSLMFMQVQLHLFGSIFVKTEYCCPSLI